MNKIVLMGRLTRDPDIRYSQGQTPTAIGKFSLAVDRRFKREGEPDADFFNCIAFGKIGEFVEKYLRKGTKVVLTGRVANDNYEKDGVKHYSVSIIAEEIEFAESKSTQEAPKPQAATSNDGFMNIPTGIDDELPFA